MSRHVGLLLLLACHSGVKAKSTVPRRNAQGTLVTGERRYDQFFARARALEEELQTKAASVQALLRPLGIALGLPNNYTTEDLGIALRKAERTQAKIVVAGQEAKLVTVGRPLEPAPQLMVDTALATIRDELALESELTKIHAELEERRRECEQLTHEVEKAFGKKSPRFRQSVVAELQARWQALGALRERAKEASELARSIAKKIAAAI